MYNKVLALAPHTDDIELGCGGLLSKYKDGAEIDAIAFKSALNSDGKKKKHVAMDKGEDANLAGTKHSRNCSIYLF